MLNVKDFENSFRLSKISLELSGIEVFPKKLASEFVNYVRQWLFYFNLIWLYPDVIAEFYWVIDGLFAGKTFDELSMSAPCAAICILATVKSGPLYYNRDIIKNVIDKLKSIHPEVLNKEQDDTNHISIKHKNADHNPENTYSNKTDNKNTHSKRDKDLERKIVKEAMKFLNLVVMFLYYLSVVVVIVFTMAPIGSMLYEYWRGRTVNLKIPFHAKYFFDTFTPLNLPLVYYHQVWSTVIVATNVFAADSLFYALCIYLQMHFRLLRHQFENALSTSSAVTRENFRLALKRHQELIEKTFHLTYYVIWYIRDVKKNRLTSQGNSERVVKSHTLYYNRRLLRRVLDKLRSMHPEDNIENVAKNTYKDFEKRIEKEALKFLNMVVKFLYYSCAAVMLMFSTLPLIYMLYEFLTMGKTNRKLPYSVWYFFDPTTSLRWPFIYIQQDWASFICCFNIFGADSLLYALVTYLQMHFRLLCYQYETIVSPDNMVETKQRFRKVVQKHQKLIQLVEQTELLYTKSTLFNIMSSSLLICLSGFIITFVDDVGTVLSFVTFLIMSLSQIFLLCYFGDMLMTSSTQVFEAVYNCKWYEADQDIKRFVLLVMIRALRPCKLTAMNFADLNLSAFTTILSRSWSYFALLKTIMDD